MEDRTGQREEMRVEQIVRATLGDVCDKDQVPMMLDRNSQNGQRIKKQVEQSSNNRCVLARTRNHYTFSFVLSLP